MELYNYVISENQLIESAIEMIEMNSSRCVIIVNSTNKIVGMISEGDILRAILKGTSIKSPVANIMNTSFKYLMKIDDEKILSYFKKGITLIPILSEQGEVTDVVDMIKYLSEKQVTLTNLI